MAAKLEGELLLIGLAVGAGVLYWMYKNKPNLDPTDPDNVVNKAVNNTLFPDGSDSVGTWIFNATHPNSGPQGTTNPTPSPSDGLTDTINNLPPGA